MKSKKVRFWLSFSREKMRADVLLFDVFINLKIQICIETEYL